MARNRDLPSWLAAVHPRYQVPHRAELALAVVVSVLVLFAHLRGVIGLSSFSVLVYYAIANAAALPQPGPVRRTPRWINVLGIDGCLALVVALPGGSVVTGFALAVLGLVGRWLVLRRRTRQEEPNRTARAAHTGT